MYINLISQIANFAEVWYVTLFASLISGLGGLIGVIWTIKYYKERDERKTYLELISKGGVFVDLYRLFIINVLDSEKLRLGLEIDKYYLDMKRKDKFAVDKCILESSNFALYKDAKNRKADMKVNLAKSLEVFWTITNQNVARYPENGNSYKKVVPIGEAIKNIDKYQMRSYKFTDTLQNDMADQAMAVLKKTPLNWAMQEEIKMNAVIKEDAKELEKRIVELDNKIKDLSDYLWPYFMISWWRRRLISIRHQ